MTETCNHDGKWRKPRAKQREPSNAIPQKAQDTLSLPFIPATSHEFITLMEQIWSIDSEPVEGGGIYFSPSPFYDEWSDAIKVARAIGLAHTGSSTLDGEYAFVFRFPDETGVRIAGNGAAVRPATRRHRAAEP